VLRTLRGLIPVLILAFRAGPAEVAFSNTDSTRPSCLDVAVDSAGTYRKEAVRFTSGDVSMAGQLFLPVEPGPHPGAVLLHGGGQARLNEAPLFFAPLLAQCGIAALVYDKRGTGASGGVWEDAFFDDFAVDAAAAVAALAARPDIEADRVGLVGFSQGGGLAPVVSVRYGRVAFIVSISGPFTSLEATRLYALEQRLIRWGLSGTVLDSTLLLWQKHFAAVAHNEAEALIAMDDEIQETARRYGKAVLPPTADRLPRTPMYNSMGRDYTAELKFLRTPMLAVYGDRDAVVPVRPSIDALQNVLEEEGRRRLDVHIIPFADHSFTDWTFKQRIKVEEIVIAWIQARLADTSTGAPSVGTTQKR